MNFQNKMSDFEDKIDKLYENYNSLSMEMKLKSIAQAVTTTMNDPNIISKEDANSAKFYVELTEYKMKYDNLAKDYDLFKKNYKVHNQQQQQQQFTNPVEKKEKSVKNETVSFVKNEEFEKITSKIEMINDQINSLKEKNIIVDFNLDSKVSREEIEKVNKQMSMEIDKFQVKINESFNKIESKAKPSDSGTNPDKVELVSINYL